MIGRKQVLGLSLLGALALFAFTAQSAFAVSGWTADNNTTAYTCVPLGGNLDFEDAHCDNQVPAGTGPYGHELIEVGETTEIETTNAGVEPTEAAHATLTSTLFGIKVTLTAETVSGTGSIKNVGEGTNHSIEGNIGVEYTNVTVSGLNHCGVEEPIEVPAAFHSVHTEGGEMGLEFVPTGAHFTEITFVNSGGTCALNGVTINVDGSAVGVGGAGASSSNSGATVVFGEETEELNIGGSPATFTSTVTNKMVNGNPISATTVTE